MRHSVLRFALAMDDALGKNVHRGHWRHRTSRHLLDRLREAQVHLSLLVNGKTPPTPDEVLRHATSAANYAMMIADLAGALEKPWQP